MTGSYVVASFDRSPTSKEELQRSGRYNASMIQDGMVATEAIGEDDDDTGFEIQNDNQASFCGVINVKYNVSTHSGPARGVLGWGLVIAIEYKLTIYLTIGMRPISMAPISVHV